MLELRSEAHLGTGGKMADKLKFYDLRAKKSFQTDKYNVQAKSGRRFAVATSPTGTKAYRILGKK